MKLKLNDLIKRSIENSFIEKFFTQCMDVFVENNLYNFREYKAGLNKDIVNYGTLKDFVWFICCRKRCYLLGIAGENSC